MCTHYIHLMDVLQMSTTRFCMYFLYNTLHLYILHYCWEPKQKMCCIQTKIYRIHRKMTINVHFSIYSMHFCLWSFFCIFYTFLFMVIFLYILYIFVYGHFSIYFIHFLFMVIFSSPEHEVLMVSYCGQSMSVVRPPTPLGQLT